MSTTTRWHHNLLRYGWFSLTTKRWHCNILRKGWFRPPTKRWRSILLRSGWFSLTTTRWHHNLLRNGWLSLTTTRWLHNLLRNGWLRPVEERRQWNMPYHFFLLFNCYEDWSHDKAILCKVHMVKVSWYSTTVYTWLTIMAHTKHEFHETCHSVTFYLMKKVSTRCCDTTTPESIHTKDESKRGFAFAFIYGVNWPLQWM